MGLEFKEVATGQSIHHYRVEAELGQGGMGKVFQAWDEHLDRYVAIKVLAVQAFQDNDRKERFLREARIASALNHPNILHMYDVDQTPEGIDYIVMEYVKGKTLGALINGRGLPLTMCVKYARQIAAALAVGHEKGIIHRDIKPANVMIAEDGTVKVLDYGLSILTEPAESLDPDKTTVLPSSSSGGARRNPGSTLEGAVVGTVPYMSPEQTRGEPCDTRSDIFSFGSLLYEMLTGRRAFGGDAAATVMSAILRDQPEPARANGEAIPREMDEVITRCLQKDPARRFQCMHDVKVALEEVVENVPAEDMTQGRKTWPWAMAAGVAAVLILGAGLVLGRILKPPQSTSVRPPQVMLLSRDADYPRFSPDGKWVVYAAYRSGNMELFKRLPDGGDETRLTNTAANETQPAWSRDGWIAFVSDQDGGGIFELSADQPGGPVRRLTSGGKNPRWAPDGHTLAYEKDGGVYVLVRGEAPRQIVSATGGSPQMAWSPDGKQLILWNYSQNDVCIVPVTGGTCRLLGLVPLGEEASGLSWSKDGRWLIMSRGPFSGAKALWAIPFDSSSGKPTGTPVRLTVSTTDDIHCALSPDGRTLVYSARDVDQDLYSFPINPETGLPSAERRLIPISVSHRNYYPAVSRSGDVLVWTAQTGSQGLLYLKRLGQREDEQRLTGDTQSSMREVTATLSPDARQVIYSSTIGGSYALWHMPAMNQLPVKLTATAGRQLDSQPAWSPDGKTIAFYSNRSGNLDIWSVDASGKDLRRITDWKSNEYWPVWSPDGRRLAFVSDKSGNSDIWVRDNTTGTIAPYIQEPAEEGYGTWSPNGRYFYFSSDRSGEFQIWVRNERTGEVHQVTDFKGPSFGLPQSALYTKFAVADSQLIVPLQTRKTDVAILQNWQGVR
jgi:eukaryotic-like serine/threonine-protein kinase